MLTFTFVPCGGAPELVLLRPGGFSTYFSRWSSGTIAPGDEARIAPASGDEAKIDSSVPECPPVPEIQNSKFFLFQAMFFSFSVCTIMEFLLEDTLPEAVVLSEISGDSLEMSSSLQTEYWFPEKLKTLHAVCTLSGSGLSQNTYCSTVCESD